MCKYSQKLTPVLRVQTTGRLEGSHARIQRASGCSGSIQLPAGAAAYLRDSVPDRFLEGEISAGIHSERRKQDKIRDGTYGKRQDPLPAADDGHRPGRKLQDGLVLGQRYLDA